MTSALLSAWKRLPAPVREAAHRGVEATAYALTPALVRANWRRGRPGGEPVTVMGLLRSSTGLGDGARLFLQALQGEGVRAEGLDAGPWAEVAPDLPPWDGADDDPGAGGGGALVSHLNPLELERVLRASWARPVRGRRHVGYWAWELPQAPDSWRRAFRFVDEVWAPSAFTADALRALAPASTPVRVVPHPVCARPPAVPDRAGFGLPPDACLVLVALDLKSTAARKNPRGALEAWRRAVPRPRPDATLVCKVGGADVEPALFAALAHELAGRPDVRLLDAVLPQARMDALLASVDVVLSLHRAEGFGLVPAQAMRLGKAVVATGWSGVMDYMTPETAALVRYDLTPAVDPQGLYAGALWAEPDIAHAAELLRELLDDPAARGTLGERARLHAERVFDTAAWTARVRAGLTAPERAD